MVECSNQEASLSRNTTQTANPPTVSLLNAFRHGQHFLSATVNHWLPHRGDAGLVMET